MRFSLCAGLGDGNSRNRVEHSPLRRKAVASSVPSSSVRLGLSWNPLVVSLSESPTLNLVMRFTGISLFTFIGSSFVCVLDASTPFLYGPFSRKSWRLWETLACFRSPTAVMNPLEQAEHSKPIKIEI